VVLHQIVVAVLFGKTEHASFEGCYEILGMLALLGDQSDNTVQIDGIKSCIDFIKDIERSWFTLLKGHQHAHSYNCFLSS